MAPVHRDKETGQIHTNGSKIGGVFEWARWVSQVIIIPFMVASFWWAASVQKFMWVGDRQTVQMANEQHRAMEVIWESRFADMPLVDEKFDALGSQIIEIKAQARINQQDLIDRINRQNDAIQELAKELREIRRESR